MATTIQPITIEELERDGAPEGRWELIDGELVAMAAAGEKHGRIVMAIGIRVGSFVLARRLGYVYSSETGFVVATAPRTVRMPDVSFVCNERLAPDRDQSRFLRLAPDLVVEVISPWDGAGEVLAKVMMWLDAGSSLVWLVDPPAETVTVFAHDAAPQVLAGEELLDGGAVLPGLTLAVREIFAS